MKTRAALVIILLLWPAQAALAQEPWLSLLFNDLTPPTFTFPAGGGGSDDMDLQTDWGPGTCALGVAWNHTRIAASGGNGCFADRGCYRITMCDFAVSDIGDGDNNPPGESTNTWTAGYFGATLQIRPDAGWPVSGSPFFGRVRLYFETPAEHTAGGDNMRQQKWFIWHRAISADRVIGYLESGSNCGQSDATHVCFTLQRNINHSNDTATVAMTTGQWHHLQWSWRHGVVGTSYLKIWLNNNTEGSPSAQDLTLDGAGTWTQTDSGYEEQFDLAGVANAGTQFDGDFIYRMQEFELGGTFDSDWAVGLPIDRHRIRIRQANAAAALLIGLLGWRVSCRRKTR